MATTSTVVLAAVVLWFAQGWYLNAKLLKVHDKLDRIQAQFFGLRAYLYEIDPQFDDERELLDGLHSERPERIFDSVAHMDLENEKKAAGRRTLSSLFLDGGFRSPRQGGFER